MSDQPRPVWLTREQRDDLSRIRSGYASILVLRAMEDIIAAWDAAPADAAGPHGAVRVAITNAYYDARNAGETMETAADNARDGVLRALRMPEVPAC